MKNKASFTLFLHRHGYNYFNINRLTIPEINLLVDAHNEEQKQKKRDYEAAKRKKRR